jgi:hypothetical protein
MNKQKMKHNALEAMMIVVFMLSVMCIGSGSALPFVGIVLSASALALLN